MYRYWFFLALALGLVVGEPALACRTEHRIVLEDVLKASVVVVGRISNYRVISGSTRSSAEYARFDIQVDEFLVGRTTRRISISWTNSTFNVPRELGAGLYLIALQGPATNPHYEIGSYNLLQAHCAEPFLFDSTGRSAMAVRRILTTPRS